MAHSKDDDDHYTDDLLPSANENAISTASSLLPLNDESEFPHDEDGSSSLVGPMGHHQMNHTTTPTTNSHCSNNIPIFIKELLNEKDQTICKYIWSNPVHCGEISQEETSTIEPSHNNTTQKNCDAFISELYKQ
ncbi:hypothetical protein C9374_001990 [Naegleria lovaniensis]|uniref:Uncharacterized protein n=1 Tax=Naegleria lovaniensis TaxID=51637 RepID=A0AA88GU56_NAELO|nr:uncharacterized protein C9374_001990 [Naegleria lovaniensis]KAG2386955.1 hypothetical protein C9374_001990 [Naegleria lovaniensis]